MDAPDDASICWLGLVHVVRCCRLSGLMMRLVQRRGPLWRIADRVQIGYASSIALRSGGGFPDPVSLTVCPYPSSVLPTSPTASCSVPPDQAAAGTRYLCFVVITAQTMRAILLARATATSIRGLCASILASQGSGVEPRRSACRR